MRKFYALIYFIFVSNLLVCQISTFEFPASSSLIVTSKDVNVSVSDMVLSSGTIETNITTGNYFPNEPYIQEGTGWIATDQTSAKSFQFTITANSGYTFSITNISFRSYATAAGPSAFGFAIGSTNLYQINAPDGSLIVVNQAVSGQTGLTSATIKIQGWLNGSRSSSGGGDFRLDDIIITGSVALPVELISFIAHSKSKVTNLFFSTASETNNDYFNIERSADGRDFSIIGEIDGAGNSTSEISYEFIDESPLPGINYYRIKQTDFDGQNSYSDIRSVRFGSLSAIQVSPGTTEGRLTIATTLENYSVTIINAAGQMMKKYSSLSLDQTMDIEDLHSGLYFIRVSSSSDVETTRVIKI